MKININTSKGNMIAELYANDTPKTVENFIELTNKGFYEGLKFHRVIPNFTLSICTVNL